MRLQAVASEARAVWERMTLCVLSMKEASSCDIVEATAWDCDHTGVAARARGGGTKYALHDA